MHAIVKICYIESKQEGKKTGIQGKTELVYKETMNKP